MDGQLTLRSCVSGILSKNALQSSLGRNQHTPKVNNKEGQCLTKGLLARWGFASQKLGDLFPFPQLPLDSWDALPTFLFWPEGLILPAAGRVIS